MDSSFDDHKYLDIIMRGFCETIRDLSNLIIDNNLIESITSDLGNIFEKLQTFSFLNNPCSADLGERNVYKQIENCNKNFANVIKNVDVFRRMTKTCEQNLKNALVKTIRLKSEIKICVIKDYMQNFLFAHYLVFF